MASRDPKAECAEKLLTGVQEIIRNAVNTHTLESQEAELIKKVSEFYQCRVDGPYNKAKELSDNYTGAQKDPLTNSFQSIEASYKNLGNLQSDSGFEGRNAQTIKDVLLEYLNGVYSLKTTPTPGAPATVAVPPKLEWNTVINETDETQPPPDAVIAAEVFTKKTLPINAEFNKRLEDFNRMHNSVSRSPASSAPSGGVKICAKELQENVAKAISNAKKENKDTTLETLLTQGALVEPASKFYQCWMKDEYQKVRTGYNKAQRVGQQKLPSEFEELKASYDGLMSLKDDPPLSLRTNKSDKRPLYDLMLEYIRKFYDPQNLNLTTQVKELIKKTAPPSVEDGALLFSEREPRDLLDEFAQLLSDFNDKLSSEVSRSSSGLRQPLAAIAASRSRNTVRNGLVELRSFLEKFYFQPPVSEGNPALFDKLKALEKESASDRDADVASLVSRASELRIEALRATRQILDEKLKKNLQQAPLCPDDQASKAFRDLFTRDLDAAAARLSSAVRNSNAAAAGDIAQLRSKVRPSDLPTEDDIAKLRGDIDDLEAELDGIRKDRELQLYGIRGSLSSSSATEERRKLNLLKEKRDSLKKKEALRERNKSSLDSIPNSRRYESALTAIANSVQNYYDEVTRAVSKVKEKIICAEGVSDELVALVGLFTLRLNFFMGDVVSRAELTDQLENDRMYLEKTGFETDVAKVDRILSRVDGFVQQTLAEIERFHANLFIEISQPVDKLRVLVSSTSGVIYAFKLAKAAVSVGAAYVSQKLFEGLVKRVTGVAGSGGRDLRWFVAIYASFDLLFSLAILAVSWIVLRSTSDDYSDIMKDIAVDFVVTSLMVCASLVWISDIVQDTRYFGYRSEPERAIRIIRNLASTLGVVHGVLPYFFLVGPFYTGRAAVRAALPKTSRTPYVFTEAAPADGPDAPRPEADSPAP